MKLMLRRLSPFVFCLLSLSALAQEQILSAHIVDAETGEPLPYTLVCKATGEGRGTLANVEGNFSISVSPDDVLTFSFVGYEKVHIAASEVPPVIRLKPFEQMLQEIVVEPFDEESILNQIIKNLKSDFSKHKKDRGGYFMRALLKNKSDSYLIESILAARSAVNLREEEFISGTMGMNIEGNISRMGLRLTNIQRLTEIGARTSQSTYWQETIKPLNSVSMTRKYYNVEFERFFGNDGEKLYRIVFSWNDRHAKSIETRRYLTGTAFVDAKTLKLLRFEGNVNNAFQWNNFNRQPTIIDFQMNYDYSRGFASVNSLAVHGGNDEMFYRILLYNVQDDDFLESVSGSSDNNMLKAVDDAGFDVKFWERINIVKRTEEEERAAIN